MSDKAREKAIEKYAQDARAAGAADVGMMPGFTPDIDLGKGKVLSHPDGALIDRNIPAHELPANPLGFVTATAPSEAEQKTAAKK